ncbi:kinesin-like protein, partial [Haematococcus lacustris]
MSGREEVISSDVYRGDVHDGIITRAVHYLYNQISERQDAQFSLSASYLEIYNEGVFDLLTPRAAGGEGLAGGRAV